MQEEGAQLVLKSTDLTSYDVGSRDLNKFVFRNVDFRKVLGDLYDEHEEFEISLLSVAETPATAITYLVVGGGGGASGGGGGAGGVVYTTVGQEFTGGEIYTITVGAGGTGAVNAVTASNGGDSSISGTGITTIVAKGGGASGRNLDSGGASNGIAGGSGGAGSLVGMVTSVGGASNQTTYANHISYGNAGGGNGGFAQTLPFPAGGGGGAGNSGKTAPTYLIAGNGGDGILLNITGTPTYYAGGGGGGLFASTVANSSSGTGGSGIGGNGGYGATSGTAGVANTGSGGGGNGSSSTGGSGGSGVVILSIPTSIYSGLHTGTVTVSTAGDNTILRYTTSGTYIAASTAPLVKNGYFCDPVLTTNAASQITRASNWADFKNRNYFLINGNTGFGNFVLPANCTQYIGIQSYAGTVAGATQSVYLTAGIYTFSYWGARRSNQGFTSFNSAQTLFINLVSATDTITIVNDKDMTAYTGTFVNFTVNFIITTTNTYALNIFSNYTATDSSIFITGVSLTKTANYDVITALPITNKVFTANTLTVNSFTDNKIYKNGDYTINASSQFNIPEYASYYSGNTTNINGWVTTVADGYNTTTPYAYKGTTTTTLLNTTTKLGAYIQYEFPYSFILRTLTITQTRNWFYGNFYVYGANSLTNSWVQLYNGTGTGTAGYIDTYNLTTNTTAYKYYRIVITTALTTTSVAGIRYINFIGIHYV
jgi:hypothetical protein